jgi:hypothetical protein
LFAISKVNWKQTKVQLLLKDEISGGYYARFWRDGKAVWRTFGADVFFGCKADATTFAHTAKAEGHKALGATTYELAQAKAEHQGLVVTDRRRASGDANSLIHGVFLAKPAVGIEQDERGRVIPAQYQSRKLGGEEVHCSIRLSYEGKRIGLQKG